MFSRSPSGTEDIVTIAPSGWLYENTFVLYDIETESIWFPLDGAYPGILCVSGEYEGRYLEALPGTKLRWSDWVDRHPDTKLMCYASCPI